MHKHIMKKLAAAALTFGVTLSCLSSSVAFAEVYSDPQMLSDKEQWKIAGLLNSAKTVAWLNKAMSKSASIPSQVKSIRVVSFNFNKGSRAQIRSIAPVPFDKIGVISAYAELTFENGKKEGGILQVDNPSEKGQVLAYWLPAEEISALFKAEEAIKDGGNKIPVFRKIDFDDSEVQNCVAQGFMVRPVSPQSYPYQRWVRCTDPDQRKEILTPEILIPQRY